MKIAYTTTFDAQDVNNWSGTPYYMSRALQEAGNDINYIGNLQRKLSPLFKIQQIAKKYIWGLRDSPRFNVVAAQHYSQQVAKLITDCDVIVSPQINPIAYLETTKPLILWTDALYDSMLNFYPAFLKHSAASRKQGHIITQACLDHCSYAIFSSAWAAQEAMQYYAVKEDKIKVIPYGANLSNYPHPITIKANIAARSAHILKLLFIGKDWHRKGGDVVFRVVKAMHNADYPIELHFVGCKPPLDEEIPPYIHVYGFVSKRTAEGRQLIDQLLANCHFLFVPSRAEAYGIVFCEANAYGLPCIATQVGGIPTIVKSGVNGELFALDASIETYCMYLIKFYSNFAAYQQLASSALNESQTRLNWRCAVNSLKSLLT